MSVDSVLVVGVIILIVIGESQNGREFTPARLIEIGVASAGINGGVPDANIRQPVRVIISGM